MLAIASVRRNPLPLIRKGSEASTDRSTLVADYSIFRKRPVYASARFIAFERVVGVVLSPGVE